MVLYFVETFREAGVRQDFGELLSQLSVNVLHQITDQEAFAEELRDAQALPVFEVRGERLALG